MSDGDVTGTPLTGPPDPLRPAHLHIGARTIDLPLPEAGKPGEIRFPGADIWVEGASEDWLAVLFSAVLVAEVREADERHNRAPRWGAA